MATKLNLNQYPHFDDYKDTNKYYQILFRPGRSVQARELTQLQTMLQRQIERFGKHIFKNGSNVIPGTERSIRYTPGISFIKLPVTSVMTTYIPGSTTQDELAKAIQDVWINSTIKTVAPNQRSGITGKIIGYKGPDNITSGGSSAGEIRFFVNMLTSSADGQYSTFQSGDTIQLVDGLLAGLQTSIPSVASTSNQLKVGTVSSVTVEEGVYFYNGYFVFVEGHTLFLEPIDPSGQYTADSIEMQGRWSDLPTTTVGLKVVEEVKTFQDDDSLLDNASGTPNYSAPGADRLYISADLAQIPYNPTQNAPDNFITLMEISNGTLYSVLDSPEYGPLMDTLARRTYDESGDYIVDNMSVQITEFLRDDDTKNNGTHSISEFQFFTAATASECAEKMFGLKASLTKKNYFGPHTDDFYYPGTSYDAPGDATSFKKLCDSFLTARIDPGKAYVKGYEIRKLAKSTIDIPKSRTHRFLDNTTVSTPLGRYFSVTDLVGNIVFTDFLNVDLYAARRQGLQTSQDGIYSYDFSSSATLPSYCTGLKIGTAKLVKIEADSDNGPGFYKAYVTDIQMIGSNQISSVKLLHAPTNGIFAHPTLSTYELSGSVTSGTTSGSNITVSGAGATWTTSTTGERLKLNDYVYVEDTQELYRVVTTPVSNGSITLSLEGSTQKASPSSAAIIKTFANSKFSGTYATIESDTNNTGVIYQLPDTYVKTIRGASQAGAPSISTKMAYTIEHLFDNSGTGLSVDAVTNSITINVPNAAFEFDANIFKYKVIRKHTTTNERTILNITSGSSSSDNSSTAVLYQNSGSSLKFHFSSANSAATYTYSILVPLIKSGVLEKKKILRYGSFSLVKLPSGEQKYAYTHTGTFPAAYTAAAGEGPGYKVVDAANNSEIHLGNSGNKICDVFRITRIIASKDKDTEPSSYFTLNDGDVDITALYNFDNGQSEYYYGYPKLYLRPNYPKPIGKVRVEYDYFDHDDASGGDYFSVDSYTHDEGVSYEDIPSFRSNDGTVYTLADCIDFRKKITDSPSVTVPSGFLTCSYFAYNGRSDKIVLSSKTKQFELLKGVPDVNPEFPEDVDYAMTLVELHQNPYGVGKDSCRMRTRDNRRYTMRDIGKLEKRIENLEYYTSLNLLEQETSRLRITDANGNDRFKNGFLTDSFKSFDSSDTDNFDFSCSIDTQVEHAARPLVTSDHFSLTEDISNFGFELLAESLRNPNGGVTNYTKAGDVYLLPYKKTDFITQKIASKVVNVNPYAVFTYVGNISLTPWSDTWRETKYSEINVFDDKAYQEARKLVTGEINYNNTRESVTTTKGKWRKTDKYKLVVAGHLILESLSPKERAETLKRKKYKVPSGYANAGEWVDIDTKGGIQVQRVLKQVTTTTIQRIRQGFDSDIKKTDITTTKQLTKDETTDIQFMRSIDVVVDGSCFRPNSNLYPYFDDVPVTKYCRPVEVNDVDNWVTYRVSDSTSPAVGDDIFIPMLPVDSPIRYFKLHSSDSRLSFVVSPFGQSIPGTVRVGCEVEVTGIGGIKRKFDVIGILADPLNAAAYTTIQVREKQQTGMLGIDMAAITSVPGAAFDVKISKYAFGDQIQTSGTGAVKCVFRIPNEDGNRFKTGQAAFVLSTSSASSKSGSGISRASANFLSKGTLNTQETTITQTQQFTISSHLVDQSSTEVKTSEIYDTGPIEIIDPISQTFRVRETGGCFITDIDIFFAKRPTGTIRPDVTLELRTVSQTGQPEAAIVGGPIGKVIKKASEVVVNKVTIQDQTGSSLNNTLQILVDGLTSASEVGGSNSASGGIEWTASSIVKSDSLKDGSSAVVAANVPFVSNNMSADMIPTRFTFKTPIFLEQNKSYCFVILSDSDEYEVWVAQRGPYGPLDQNKDYGYYDQVGVTNVKIGTTESLDNQQLYVDGDFFKSKNGFGWQIDPTVSIKFNLLKAIFDTRNAALPKLPNVGEIVFVNETLSWTDVADNGLEIRPGSDLIRVHSVNHGASVGDKVRFIFDSVADATGKIRGFSKAALQNEDGLPVINTEVDFFTVRVIPKVSTWSVVADSNLAKEQYRLGAFSTSSTGARVPSVKMRLNKKYEQLILTSNTFCPPGTSIEWTIQTVPGIGVNEYDATGSLVSRNPLKEQLSPITLIPGTPIEFESPMLLLSPENEKPLSKTTNISRTDVHEIKSVLVKARLISDNNNLSPVLDSGRLAATTVSTRLDSPVGIYGAVGNNINITEDNFDKLTVFEKGLVPLEKTLTTTNAVIETVRSPAYSSTTALTQNLSFSQATNTLAGTFSQEFNSKIIIGTGSNLVGTVSPGDTIINLANMETRVVEKVVSATKMIINEAFNPHFSGGTLAIGNDYMRITTTDASLAAHLSQLDVGKYATLQLFTYNVSETLTTSATKTVTVSKLPFTIVSVTAAGVTVSPASCQISGKVITLPSSVNASASVAITYTTTEFPTSIASATATPGFVQVSSTQDSDYSKLFSDKLILGVDYTPNETVKCTITIQHLNTGSTTVQADRCVTLYQWDRFIDELAYEGGSASSRYICKKLNLDRPATSLKISFDAIRDEYSFIDLYYRTESPNETVTAYDKNWTKATYNIEVDGILTIKAPEPSESEFRAYETSIQGLTEFTGVQAKIVLRGGNPAKPPKIKNFRLIALDE